MFQKWTVLHLILVMTKEGHMNNFLLVLYRPENNESSKAGKALVVEWSDHPVNLQFMQKKMFFSFYFSLQFVRNTISLEHLG